jgi:hypothetical protein
MFEEFVERRFEFDRQRLEAREQGGRGNGDGEDKTCKHVRVRFKTAANCN